MRKLKFDVEEQKIKKNDYCDFSNIVSGTKGYLFAKFSFSNEWIGMVKVAEFRRFENSECYSVKIVNGMCEIPSEVLSRKRWFLNVVGKKKNIILTTNKISVSQEV